MTITARTWRIRRYNKARGAYYAVECGRNDSRVSIALQYVAEDEAQTALSTIQAEEDAGTVDRVLALKDSDPEAARRYLLGDRGVAELMPASNKQLGRLTLRRYLDEVWAPVRAPQVKSWRAELGHLNKVLGQLGDIRVDRFEVRTFARWARDAQLDDGSPMSGAYKRLCRNALQQLLNHAYVEEHIDERVHLGAIKIKGSTKRAREQVVPLDLDELLSLMNAADPKQRAMWGVCGGQGMRPGELNRIRWEDVDWSERLIRVRGTKTDESDAVVPLTPLSFRELRSWWMRSGQPAFGVVFPSRVGGGAYKAGGWTKALRTDAQAAGIDRHVVPYIFRASFVTIAWSLGIDQDTVRRITRHTDLKMIRDVYCRPRPAELVARVAAFDF